MEPRNCTYCINEEEYVCVCRGSLVPLCEEHVTEHLAQPYTRHSLRKASIPLTSDEEDELQKSITDLTNSFLIQKKRDSEASMLFVKYEEIIIVLYELIKRKALPQFSRLPILTELCKCKRENCYLNSCLLAGIFRRVIFLEVPEVPHKTPLYTHSLFIESNKIGLLNGSGESYFTAFKPIPACFSSLIIDSDSILITFRTCTYLIKVSACVLQDYPPTKRSRTNHAMTWIQQYPAVLAGSHRSTPLKTVEILVHDEWRPFTPLNICRQALSACSTASSVYVFGGLIYHSKRTNTIERLTQGLWDILTLKLPFLSSDFSVVLVSSNILILGGSYNSKKVWKFDPDTLQITRQPPLKMRVVGNSLWFRQEKALISLYPSHTLAYELPFN